MAAHPDSAPLHIVDPRNTFRVVNRKLSGGPPPHGRLGSAARAAKPTLSFLLSAGSSVLGWVSSAMRCFRATKRRVAVPRRRLGGIRCNARPLAKGFPSDIGEWVVVARASIQSRHFSINGMLPPPDLSGRAACTPRRGRAPNDATPDTRLLAWDKLALPSLVRPPRAAPATSPPLLDAALRAGPRPTAHACSPVAPALRFPPPPLASPGAPPACLPGLSPASAPDSSPSPASPLPDGDREDPRPLRICPVPLTASRTDCAPRLTLP